MLPSSLLPRLLSAAALTLLTTGPIVAQERQARAPGAPFERVESSGGIDVYLTQGPTAAVAVEAQPEVLPRVVTEVKANTLVIRWEKGFQPWKMANRPFRAKVYVTAPRLSGVTLSGGADAHGQTPITTDNFQIEASGGGDVSLTLHVKTLRADASGGSDLTLTGRAETQEISTSGGSDYHGFGLRSTTARIGASGGSDAEVWVEGDLTADASGGSDLRYRGAARVSRVSSSGSSSVRRVKE